MSDEPDARAVDGETSATGGSGLDELVDVMSRVLDRCVWSQGMSHSTLVPYLIEECHELVDAIESGSADEIAEELGDVLWQIVFHAEIAARTEGEGFDLDDVARRLTAKVVRRHPHVFAGEVATTAEEVVRLWDAAKSREKSARTSVLDGIARSMPALALADKVLGRAARVLDEVPSGGEAAGDEDELGDRLLTLVAAARAHGLDAERALRMRVRALEDEVRTAEAQGEG